MRSRGRILVFVLVATTAGCHLAEDVDPPNCQPGTHVENRVCVEDDVQGAAITISAAAGGTSCTGAPEAQRPPVVDPDPLQVASGGPFRFVNKDTVDHEIRGADGQVWATVKAGDQSVLTSIAKKGSWEYHVSGCAKADTVVVE